jgi:hypothetical protein
VFAYLVAWATVKPPMQAPDEYSHVVKALSMPGAPWIPPRDSLPVPDGRWNPLCLMPHELLRLVGNARNLVGDEDLATLRRVRWPGSGQTLDRFTQAWSYPPVFYWVAFALGQGATSALRLTPYDSMFAWRVGVSLVSAVLWTLVLIVLRRVDGDPAHRSWIAVFLLANPMLAFISSSVNPDALLVPLSVLVVLLSFLQARDGGYAFATFVAVLAACLVKITGVFVVAALFPAVLVMLAFRRTSVRDALEWFRAAAGACLLAWIVFYAWSPPRLYGPPMAGRSIRLTEYLTYLDEHAEERWTSFWGRLGWLDYQADQWFYTALWWAFAVAAVVALARIRRWRIYGGVVGFAFTFGLCFLVLTFAGEFAQVHEIGFTFQGRYALPASIGISSLVLASGWLPRMAMLALVVWLNAALFDTSVHRYWGDWSRYVRAQPFAGMVTR